MKIFLTPKRCDGTLTVEKIGDVLRINNYEYDFSPIPDGSTLPSSAVDCEWISGDVERIDGTLHITLILPHGPDASEEARFPDPIENPGDGEVELPK